MFRQVEKGDTGRKGQVKFFSNRIRAAVEESVQKQLTRYRQQSDGNAQVERVLDRYRRRMYDLSIFIKELKGRFAQWYNRRHGRYGVLWAERFKSLLLEGGDF